MVWPVNLVKPEDIRPEHAYLRDPEDGFRHDGFGHTNVDDGSGPGGNGLRPCTRNNPHSGLDFTGTGPIYSVAGGKIAWTGFTKGAGYAAVEEVTLPRFGTLFPIYFHGANSFVKAGTTTEEGMRIGTIGDTGTGTSRGAYHLHFSIASSLQSALFLLNNGTYARGKRTIDQWATASGLIDPLPVLRALENDKNNADGEYDMNKEQYDALMQKIAVIEARTLKAENVGEGDRTRLDNILAKSIVIENGINWLKQRLGGSNEPNSKGEKPLNITNLIHSLRK